ncbi:hypothetical protein K7X08_014405 [Anisodus acutangulus]|uniref:Cyclin N-terminal domain-containing protein n=1 Tax=Anisodus acutangulus TaxID=402998 RepID=A0A9Q1R2V4_9SOLA|nr:hypothetical protein K7X08_014405 [Anisodus acutangulus]
MEEDWGDIFNGIQEIDSDQEMEEAEVDIGEDTEDFVNKMLKKVEKIATAGLNNRVSSRIILHGWLLQARNTAIDNIVRTGGPFMFRKITVYSAVIYVDRFLSIMTIENERFLVAKLLSTACLHLAADKWENFQVDLPEFAQFTNSFTRSIINMKNYVVNEFGGTKTCVTPISFTKYFVSRFCRDDSRKEYAKIKTVEVIMSTLGDVRLMSLKPFILAAAATLLASNPKILTKTQIEHDINNVLPPNWIIPLDEVCSCYDRLLETNMHRLDIS